MTPTRRRYFTLRQHGLGTHVLVTLWYPSRYKYWLQWQRPTLTPPVTPPQVYRPGRAA